MCLPAHNKILSPIAAMMNMPFSQASENNRGPILSVIKPLLADKHRVLEIGSGTGQHAAWFAQHMPHLIWQPAMCWKTTGVLSSGLPLIQVTIYLRHLSSISFRIIYLQLIMMLFLLPIQHILCLGKVWRDCLIAFVQLPTNGLFCLYGPMGYNGLIAPESNIQFDQFLRQQSSHRGIRQFEAINALAISAGLELLEDFALPANNRLIAWQKD